MTETLPTKSLQRTTVCGETNIVTKHTHPTVIENISVHKNNSSCEINKDSAGLTLKHRQTALPTQTNSPLYESFMNQETKRNYLDEPRFDLGCSKDDHLIKHYLGGFVAKTHTDTSSTSLKTPPIMEDYFVDNLTACKTSTKSTLSSFGKISHLLQRNMLSPRQNKVKSDRSQLLNKNNVCDGRPSQNYHQEILLLTLDNPLKPSLDDMTKKKSKVSNKTVKEITHTSLVGSGDGPADKFELPGPRKTQKNSRLPSVYGGLRSLAGGEQPPNVPLGTVATCYAALRRERTKLPESLIVRARKSKSGTSSRSRSCESRRRKKEEPEAVSPAYISEAPTTFASTLDQTTAPFLTPDQMTVPFSTPDQVTVAFSTPDQITAPFPTPNQISVPFPTPSQVFPGQTQADDAQECPTDVSIDPPVLSLHRQKKKFKRLKSQSKAHRQLSEPNSATDLTRSCGNLPSKPDKAPLQQVQHQSDLLFPSYMFARDYKQTPVESGVQKSKSLRQASGSRPKPGALFDSIVSEAEFLADNKLKRAKRTRRMMTKRVLVTLDRDMQKESVNRAIERELEERGYELLRRLLRANPRNHCQMSLANNRNNWKFSPVEVTVYEKPHEGFTTSMMILDGGREPKQYTQRPLKVFSPHPNLVMLLHRFETKLWCYQITEHCPWPTLSQLLRTIRTGSGRQHKCLSEPQCKTVFSQICSGLGYLHDQDVLHGDINCDNVLVTENLEVKLTGYGPCCQRMATPSRGINNQHNVRCQQLDLYTPPEMMGIREVWRKSCDIWCLGVTLLYMLLGHIPSEVAAMIRMSFSARNVSKFNIIRVGYQVTLLIDSMLRCHSKSRPTITQIKRHAWLVEGPLTPWTQHLTSGTRVYATKRIDGRSFPLPKRVQKACPHPDDYYHSDSDSFVSSIDPGEPRSPINLHKRKVQSRQKTTVNRRRSDRTVKFQHQQSLRVEEVEASSDNEDALEILDNTVLKSRSRESPRASLETNFSSKGFVVQSDIKDKEYDSDSPTIVSSCSSSSLKPSCSSISLEDFPTDLDDNDVGLVNSAESLETGRVRLGHESEGEDTDRDDSRRKDISVNDSLSQENHQDLPKPIKNSDSHRAKRRNKTKIGRHTRNASSTSKSSSSSVGTKLRCIPEISHVRKAPKPDKICSKKTNRHLKPLRKQPSDDVGVHLAGAIGKVKTSDGKCVTAGKATTSEKNVTNFVKKPPPLPNQHIVEKCLTPKNRMRSKFVISKACT